MEDTMFFSRLRRHAKWMFVFLALVFGLGFVVFGIGSDQGTGIGDILRDSGGQGSDTPSVSEARGRVKENPKSLEAQRVLATALVEEGETDEAITVLTKYVDKKKPADEDALRELGGLHIGRATNLAQEAQAAQLRASFLTFGTTFSSPLELGEGQTLGPDPIDEAISTQASAAVSEAYAKAQESFQAAEDTYDKLAAALPNDPNVQLDLAQVAQQSGNLPRAITAYEKFLELAPDDPSAPIVKQQITQLKEAQAPSPSG
ncbi:MAG: tetratricopeptide repeat protein [Actinomycetota bacterium]|nr:tetratricopeptide repeat protein [Actinomycetota bacterium]